MIPFSLTRRDVLIGLAIVLVAFGYRLIIIVDRAHAPAAVSLFDPLPAGTDQSVYYSHIAAYRAGDFPPPRFFFQPGNSYFLIAASAILRTDNLGALRVFQAAIASVMVGAFVMVGWLAFGRRSVGFLAGLGLALYPVSAFFDTDFVIVSQATMLLTLGLIGALWLGRSPRAWGAAVLFGLSFGAVAVTRFEPLLLAPVFGLWVLAVRRDRRAVLQVGLAALLCAAVILPVTLHNWAGGGHYLVTRSARRRCTGATTATQAVTTAAAKPVPRLPAATPRRCGRTSGSRRAGFSNWRCASSACSSLPASPATT